jgi:hypothetical protein
MEIRSCSASSSFCASATWLFASQSQYDLCLRRDCVRRPSNSALKLGARCRNSFALVGGLWLMWWLGFHLDVAEGS